MQINSKSALNIALASVVPSQQLDYLLTSADSRYGALDDDNFHQIRDFLRLNWAGADGVLLDDGHQWVPVDGGQAGHFLHVSTDDADKVAYTKDDDKGQDDTQTRTTASAYYSKYGRAASNLDVIGLRPTAAPDADTVGADYSAPHGHGGSSTLLKLLAGLDRQDDGATSADIVTAVNKGFDILLRIVNGK